MKEFHILFKQNYNPVHLETSLNSLPLKAKEWIRMHSLHEYSGYLHSEGTTYILASRGKKTSGGFGIDIVNFRANPQVAFLDITYTNPSPKSFVSLAITYPVLLIEVNEILEVIINIK